MTYIEPNKGPGLPAGKEARQAPGIDVNRSPFAGIGKRPKAKAMVLMMRAEGLDVVRAKDANGFLLRIEDLNERVSVTSRAEAEALADALLILADQVWPEGTA